MSAALVRRSFALGVVAAMATLGSPLLGAAHADTALAPVFSGSSFASDLTFAQVEARPNHVLQLPSMIQVQFTLPIKTTQVGNGTPLIPDNQAANPYFVNPATPGTHLQGTSVVDPGDNTILDVTPPASAPDGVYELHVTAFQNNACDDWSVTSVTMPSCTTYDGFVNDDAATPAPFTFTIDMTPPTADITSVNSGLASIDAAHVKSVPLAGTAAADTKSVALTVKSSASPSPRFVTTNVVAGNPATWSASPDLSSLQDGTLTITAVATDQAGNKTTPAAKVTTPMSAHPTKPLAYKVTAGDASAKLAWSPPTQTGGHPITGYSVTAKDTTAGTAPSSTSVPCAGTTCPSAYTLTGLVDGDSYDVSLAATTDVGKGAPATATVRPRAATSLTEKASAKVVSAGKSITLSGRLMRTSTGSGLAKVTLAITPKFDNGKSGKKLTAVTDIFGVWYASVRPTQNATYVVSYAGDAGNLPARAKARTKVRVRIAFTSPNSGSVGSPVVLQGRVSPAKAGSWVTIMRRTSAGNTVLGKVKLSRASTWTFTLTLPRGTTKVFARIGATAGNLGNRTSLLTLTRH